VYEVTIRQIRRVCGILCLLVVLLGSVFPGMAGAAGATFYVAPGGSDANPGTQAAPFATLARARDAVRAVNETMTGDVVVVLRGGLYRLEEPVAFDARDTGRNGHRIIYRAAEGETPVLCGGMELTGWRLHDRERNIYRAAAPKDGFRQLYINGSPGIRARTPNRTCDATFGPYWKIADPKANFLIATEHWRALDQVERFHEVEVVMISHWYAQRLLIGERTETEAGVVIAPLHPGNKFNKQEKGFYSNSFFYFENALAFVDSPGEWYHDAVEGAVYLALPEGAAVETLRVIAPRIETLLTIRGTPEQPVRDLVFEGLTFEHTNWKYPSEEGLNITQFAQPIATVENYDGAVVGGVRDWDRPDYPPGMIRAEHAQRLVFRNNTIRHAGATGIQFVMNVDDADIEGNEIYRIAANGIEIDKHAKRNPAPDEQSTGIAIWNNRIHRCGQDYTNGGGLLAHNVRGLIVEHNHIHDMPYSGIQIGNQPGGSGLRNVGCGDNIVRFNHIHHVVQLHDDGGAIYTLGGIQEGSVIAENYIHDITRGPWAGTYGIDQIYLDNWTSRILVENNVVRGGRAAQRNGSKGNTLRNNVQSNPEVEQNAGIKPGYRPTRAGEVAGSEGRVRGTGAGDGCGGRRVVSQRMRAATKREVASDGGGGRVVPNE
jgi:hypothetical protein